MPNLIAENRALITWFGANLHIDRDVSGWRQVCVSRFPSSAVVGLVSHRLLSVVVPFLESRLDLFERPSC